MFGFGKKEVKSPDERLADLQRKKDWAGVSRTCYELGVTAMDVGDLHKAHLWLHRADTIYSADDNIYDKVGEKLMDDCSDRIGRLEDEDGFFYNAIPAEIEARAQELSDPQIPGVGSAVHCPAGAAGGAAGHAAGLRGAGPTGLGCGFDVSLPPDLTLSRSLSAPDGYVQRSL